MSLASVIVDDALIVVDVIVKVDERESLASVEASEARSFRTADDATVSLLSVPDPVPFATNLEVEEILSCPSVSDEDALRINRAVEEIESSVSRLVSLPLILRRVTPVRVSPFSVTATAALVTSLELVDTVSAASLDETIARILTIDVAEIVSGASVFASAPLILTRAFGATGVPPALNVWILAALCGARILIERRVTPG